MSLISIVTVTFNCQRELTETLRSIHSQKFSDFEHIIIDGGSTDGTKDVIAEHSSKITYWISERDKGIYDAMNKGIKACTGKYMQFLNAGDKFQDENSLGKIAEAALESDADVVYGEIIATDKEDKKVYHIKPVGFTYEIVKARGTASVNHQAFFVKRALAPDYSRDYRLKGELNWYIDILERNKNITSKYVTEPIIRYKLGGAGNIHYIKNLREWVTIVQKRFGLIQNIKNIPRYKKYLEYNKRIRQYVR